MAACECIEGKIPYTVNGETFVTYYKLFGTLFTSSNPPLVVLHGGPSLSHDYLLPLSDLASLDNPTPVIFYDQLGTGRSTHLPSKPSSFWSIDLFVSELENLLSHFSIPDSFDLLGHSWGGILAAEFIIRRQPKGLRRVVLSNTLVSARLRNEAGARLRKALPGDIQEILRRHEEEGTTKAVEYTQAIFKFYQKHLCRIQPFPEELLYSFKQSELDDTVLKNMRKNGLEDKWDIRDKVHLIRVPTLLLNGEYDFETDEVCAPFFWGIEKVKWVKFAHSSHVPHWEERERYIQVVDAFLRAQLEILVDMREPEANSGALLTKLPPHCL
ncbi:hypothetical protein EW146_g6190 [Bondarzewia mesenterica]|uniref:AB hydrolase-1 domain-containing protein n=1 Tax=Bondarzewia mesenterica TaxID=1095465 RepID=A0A4S4LPE9_9AGAM|nr:hypothetical protein EW146_g6190 [Bondarzewia mesenterica]